MIITLIQPVSKIFPITCRGKRQWQTTRPTEGQARPMKMPREIASERSFEKKENAAAVQGRSSGPSSELVIAAVKRRGMIDGENRLG